MVEVFNYKLCFKDIWIKLFKDELVLEECVCEWFGCNKYGDSCVFKFNDQFNDFYWFCQSYVVEYNKLWNFFEGMSESVVQFFCESVVYGYCLIWSWCNMYLVLVKVFKVLKNFQDGFFDFYGMFGDCKEFECEVDIGFCMGCLQIKVLEIMLFDLDVKFFVVCKCYVELVCQFYLDFNGGDCFFEE